MTDWGPGRDLSNFIWGQDKDYHNRSVSRNLVHGLWHDAAYIVTRNPQDLVQSMKHQGQINEAHIRAYQQMGMTREQALDKRFENNLGSNAP